MEKDIKALLLGRAIGLASKGHRYEVGKLLDSYPEVFKPIITGLLTVR